MALFVLLWCCANSCLSSLLRLGQERRWWVPSSGLTGSYLSFMLSWSVLTWSIILCSRGSGQLLSGTPEMVVCFQNCCDGQKLDSPGCASWAGCHVHPPPFWFHRNNVSCSFNKVFWTTLELAAFLTDWLVLGGKGLFDAMQVWHPKKVPVCMIYLKSFLETGWNSSILTKCQSFRVGNHMAHLSQEKDDDLQGLAL